MAGQLPHKATARGGVCPPRPVRPGLFPVRSPLLGESLLVSFPPPNYMLKFGGCSLPIRGRGQFAAGAEVQDPLLSLFKAYRIFLLLFLFLFFFPSPLRPNFQQRKFSLDGKKGGKEKKKRRKKTTTHPKRWYSVLGWVGPPLAQANTRGESRVSKSARTGRATLDRKWSTSEREEEKKGLSFLPPGR